MNDVSGHTRARAGFSLVEVLVVIATTSAICAVAISLMITMFRSAESQSRRGNQRVAVQRLGRQFRHDVHAASAPPTLADNDVLLRLPLDDATNVTYRRTGELIVREKLHDDAVVYHDAFDLAGRWRPTIDTATSEDGLDLVRLTLARDGDTTDVAAPDQWVFEAVRGSDHRHDEPTSSSE